MGTLYVPEIFVLSEKRILSLHFMAAICPTVWIPPCCCTNPQNACAQPASCFCLVQNSVDAFFCDVQAAFLGCFTALESSLHNIQFLVILIYSNKVSIIVKQKEPIMPIQAT